MDTLVGIIKSLTNLVSSSEYANAPKPVRDAMEEWADAANSNPNISNYSAASSDGIGFTGPKKGGRKSSKKRRTRRNR